MKKTTFKKYENFLQACGNESAIPNIIQFAKAHSVSVTFVNWLIKNRYLVKLAGGSYKFMSKASGLDRIVSAYSAEYAAMRVKESKIDLTEFAYPISVRCEKDDDREKCIKLLEQIGYEKSRCDSGINVVNDHRNIIGKIAIVSDISLYNETRYKLDHFNPDLIRDIASVRTGDVWVKGEPWRSPAVVEYSTPNDATGGIKVWAGEKVGFNSARRPSIAEICDHYGYELNGMNIIKKSEAVESHTSEIVSEMKEIQSESKSLEQREAEAIKLLKSIESDHGVSYSLTKTETTKTVLL